MKQKLTQLSWALGVVLAGLLYILTGGKAFLAQQLGVLAWKLVLAGTAVGLAHVVRKQLFPYVDVSELLKQRRSIGPGLVFLGISILYAAIILAVCSGL